MNTGPRYGPRVRPAAIRRLSRLPAVSSMRRPCGSAASRLIAWRAPQNPPVSLTASSSKVVSLAHGLRRVSTGPAARVSDADGMNASCELSCVTMGLMPDTRAWRAGTNPRYRRDGPDDDGRGSPRARVVRRPDATNSRARQVRARWRGGGAMAPRRHPDRPPQDVRGPAPRRAVPRACSHGLQQRTRDIGRGEEAKHLVTFRLIQPPKRRPDRAAGQSDVFQGCLQHRFARQPPVRVCLRSAVEACDERVQPRVITLGLEVLPSLEQLPIAQFVLGPPGGDAGDEARRSVHVCRGGRIAGRTVDVRDALMIAVKDRELVDQLT